ncbi:hypothetical protein KIW84_065131 [Lathyrus oleraceus]|uniref:Uncharacterized protein n=1 Tax=Pisum sativum TaxID=3888 RepID=A0A9D5A969_PEA|nr:hypothetical protein KIW84_065131 [Pisum sativum]
MEAGLILHPYIPLDKSNSAGQRLWQRLRQIIHGALDRPIETGKNNEPMQVDLELLSDVNGHLAEVAKYAKTTKDSEYSKILSSTLTSILGWAEKRLLAYHETFDSGNVETMEGIVSLGVATTKILLEDIFNEYRRRRKTEVNVARERIET